MLPLRKNRKIAGIQKLTPLRQESSGRKQSDVDASPKGERFESESMRSTDSEFVTILKGAKTS